MSLTLVQLVQAIAFVAVILAVEGVYLLIRSGDRREKAANRRMAIAAARNERVLNPELFRKQVEGGIFSNLIGDIIPGFTRLIWRSAIRVKPVEFFMIMCAIAAATFFLAAGVMRAPMLFGSLRLYFTMNAMKIAKIRISGRKNSSCDMMLGPAGTGAAAKAGAADNARAKPENTSLSRIP